MLMTVQPSFQDGNGSVGWANAAAIHRSSDITANGALLREHAPNMV
jgi:hypothetical protein